MPRDGGAARHQEIPRYHRTTIHGDILALKLAQGAFDAGIAVDHWRVANHNRIDHFTVCRMSHVACRKMTPPATCDLRSGMQTV